MHCGIGSIERATATVVVYSIYCGMDQERTEKEGAMEDIYASDM